MTLHTGYIPDVADPRDWKLSIHPKLKAAPIPAEYDRTDHMPPVWNQGNQGSCTGHAMAAVCACMSQVEFTRQDRPSPAFLYFWGRWATSNEKQDSGANLRDVIDGAREYGVCHESFCKYYPDRLLTEKPDALALKDASDNQVLSYHAVDLTNYQELCECVYNIGPIAIGMKLYESFMSDWTRRTGKVTMPRDGEQSTGGHAMAVIGYLEGSLIVRNSWGPGWGEKGNAIIPHAVLAKHGYYGFAVDMMEPPTIN